MLFVGLFFFLLGALVKYGKLYMLMAGYNTMSVSEKKQYDIKGIANVFRNGMWIMAVIICASVALSWYFANQKLEMYGLVVATAIGIPYILLVANSNRFKVDSKD